MDHTRHANIFNAKSLSVSLVGAGGIGAATAVVLAKMGIQHMCIFDDDDVNEVNIATQLHKVSDIGNPKVIALGYLLLEFSDELTLKPVCSRVASDYFLQDFIVISAVDSIKARKDIWAAVKHTKTRWYLDARMAAEEFQLYTVRMTDPDWYDGMLAKQDDESIPDLPCTMKATIYTGFIAAGQIGAAVKAIAIGETPPRILTHNIRNNQLMVMQ